MNLLFIAIPKTGTTSIESSFFNIDKQGENHSITLSDKKLVGKNFKNGLLGHAKAKDIKHVIGDKFYNQLDTITVIRDPYSKLVSSYFYNRDSNLIKKKYNLKSMQLVLINLKTFISFLAAKILPFSLWTIIYPYKSNYDYIFDEKNNRIVKYIGRTEFLESDLNSILTHLNIDASKLNLQKLNTSKHEEADKYFRKKYFKVFISKKLKKDIELYKKVSKELNNNIIP